MAEFRHFVYSMCPKHKYISNHGFPMFKQKSFVFLFLFATLARPISLAASESTNAALSLTAVLLPLAHVLNPDPADYLDAEVQEHSEYTVHTINGPQVTVLPIPTVAELEDELNSILISTEESEQEESQGFDSLEEITSYIFWLQEKIGPLFSKTLSYKTDWIDLILENRDLIEKLKEEFPHYAQALKKRKYKKIFLTPPPGGLNYDEPKLQEGVLEEWKEHLLKLWKEFSSETSVESRLETIAALNKKITETLSAPKKRADKTLTVLFGKFRKIEALQAEFKFLGRNARACLSS